MKKLVVLSLAVLAGVFSAGCKVQINTTAFGPDNGVVSRVRVEKGQSYVDQGGGFELAVKGISADEVRITPKVEVSPKEFGPAETGVTVGLVATTILGIIAANGCNGQTTDALRIPTLTEDLRVDAGDLYFFLLKAEGSQTVPVPVLTGMTEEQVRQSLEGTCLRVGVVTNASHPTIPAGQVIDWSPKGEVPCGTAVNIVVSSGPAVEGEGEPAEGEHEGEPPVLVAVPDLTGQNWAQADVALQAVGLSVGAISTTPSATAPIGIIATWSHRGAQVPTGTAIDLVVSTGPTAEGEPEGEGEPTEGEPEGEGEPPVMVNVPDLTGRNLAQARSLLSQVGLVNGDGNVSTTASATVPVGIIADWSPKGQVVTGSTVSVVVSTGPALVTVPSLAGLTQLQAEAVLAAVGLARGNVTTEASEVVPTGIIVRWNPTGQVLPGSSVNLVVSTGSGTPHPMSVEIVSPENGSGFSVGAEVIVRVLPDGDPTKGPFKLVVSCAGKKSLNQAEAKALETAFTKAVDKGTEAKSLPTDVVLNVALGVVHESHFTLTLPGGAYFSAYLEDKDGNYVTASVSYNVQ